MSYIEVNFKISPLQPAAEILVAELSELGFESFVEEEDGLKAYILANDYDKNALEELFIIQSSEFKISFHAKEIVDENWNAKWESEYESVLIDDRCYIKAPFHESMPNVEFEILIEPKMSFGTAHHETTYQMIQFLMGENVEGKSVLDMGCGTAVLAILAKMKNASKVDAIDNDEWAYNNSVENVARNNFPEITVKQGDAANLKGRKYQLILANINKNILLRDMVYYVASMEDDAKIFFSGFYEHDLNDIKEKATQLGLHYLNHSAKNKWVAAAFSKKNTK